jgi:hypothetical protein
MANEMQKNEMKDTALDEEIDKAMKSVTITKFRTEQLHENWRRHLFKMSVGE